MRIALFSLVLFFALSSKGQSMSNSYYFGSNVAFSPIQVAIHMNAGKSAFIDDKNKFGVNTSIKLGGGRFTDKAIFVTPNEIDKATIDKIKKSEILYANISLNLGATYKLSTKWMIGVETDLLGFNLSGNSKAEFIPSESSIKNGPTRNAVETEVKLNNTNLMLFSNKNKGIIQNSIFIQNDFGFKFSITHISTQIKTDSFIGNKGNNYFTNKDFLIGVGFIHKIKQK